MALIPMDGNTKVTWVPAIANMSAPTSTELTATGVVDLSCALTPDGLDVSYDEAAVPTSRLCSTQDYEEPGRTKANITLTYYRDSVANNNKPETTLLRMAAGFLVYRPSVAQATAYAAADKVRVFSVTCGEQMDVKPAENMKEQIMQKLFASGGYQRNAVVSS